MDGLSVVAAGDLGGDRPVAEDVLNHLRQLPDREYDGPNAVSAEFSRT